MLLDAPLRIGCTKLFSFWLVPASAPTLSRVERTAALKSIPPMIVDLVLETGIALRVGAGLALQHDQAAVRHDDAVSD
jgi:hypothetical protein